jgi:hypothetical protein
MTMWILTEEINDYNQHGEYFIELFDEKPSPELLRVVAAEHGYCCSKDFIKHVLNGGGRIERDHSWLNLREHKPRDVP